ncbi:MAG: peptidylprolyl isomerase [Nitrospiraceae bacterium]|nr:peptidylprolyl isomerase [Nitrospiraceae bacterium]
MKKAQKGDTVKVHYTGKFNDGTVFDSSKGREPLQFTLGRGSLIAGFEEAVSGMASGEAKTVSIQPGNGYGLRREELVFRVKKENFPPAIDPEPGAMLQMRQPDGGLMEVRISQVAEDFIVLDANHPLAGKELVFEIEVVEVS